MIKNYHRPANQEELEHLLTRKDIKPVMVCGYTTFADASDGADVVDLQALGWDQIQQAGSHISIGGLAYLSQIVESSIISGEIKQEIRNEFTLNKLNLTTLCGALFKSKNNSSLALMMMLLDAKVIDTSGTSLSVGDWLLSRQTNFSLIKQMEINLPGRYFVEHVRKTPLSTPILSLGVHRWQSGRFRVVMGFDSIPTPALIFDGTEQNGIEYAIKNACSQYNINKNLIIYFQKTSQKLFERIISQLTQNNEGL